MFTDGALTRQVPMSDVVAAVHLGKDRQAPRPRAQPNPWRCGRGLGRFLNGHLALLSWLNKTSGRPHDPPPDGTTAGPVSPPPPRDSSGGLGCSLSPAGARAGLHAGAPRQDAHVPALTVLAVSSKTSRASSKEHISSMHSLSRFPFFISSKNEFALRTRPRTLLARSGLRNTSGQGGPCHPEGLGSWPALPPRGRICSSPRSKTPPRAPLPRDPKVTGPQAPFCVEIHAPRPAAPPACPLELPLAAQALPHLSLLRGPGTAVSCPPSCTQPPQGLRSR